MAPKIPNLTTARDIIDANVAVGSRVNVLGIVIDFRAPVPTRGKDYKAQIRLYDESISDDVGNSLLLNIFRAPEHMPDPSCGDVVLIFDAKVQRFQSEAFSLMTNWTTDVYVYSAASIPRPPLEASTALQPSGKRPSRSVTKSDNEYVTVFFHTIGKDRLPTANEFNSLKTQSLNVKDKFGLLKNVSDGVFADTIAEIVREPYDMGDKITLWISDYTENATFFSHAFKGFRSSGQESDPYNYTLRFSEPEPEPSDGDWAGPYGKMSLQVTCFEPHATAIREQRMGVGSWVLIRNLQIKYGHNAANLEGYLRGEMNAPSTKLNISLLDHLEDGSTMDSRLKEAIRRKRDYERNKKRELKSLADAAKAGQKRKAVADNSRSRRAAKRAEAFQKGAASELPSMPAVGTNEQVKCENPSKPASSIAELLEQVFYETRLEDDHIKLPLPFTNANYRTNVRIVDFYPPKLECFAIPRRARKAQDALSDNSDSSSDEEEEIPSKNHDRSSRQRIHGWEWRFYLLLEDAVVPPKEEKQRVWVAVDNHSAQSLTNLDASDLQQNADDVNNLRQCLFTLWGDLEERKLKTEQRKEKLEKAARQNGPPADSDDEDSGSSELQNRPFSCCVRQYGVKVREEEDAKMDAGPGKRWQRMYGLYGVRVTNAGT